MDDSINISNSILSSVKKLIGISEDDKSFDVDIMIHINGALSILYEIGGIPSPFTITSGDEEYDDMLPDGPEHIKNQVKLYLQYKTQLGFDSSTLSATLIDVLEKQVKELEWRLTDVFE